MAEVFLAQVSGIEGFEKQVVLKRMLPRFARHQGFVQMFLDEARLAASLHHPNICQVFDIGAQVGNYYFAMEYVHGKDVRQVFRRVHDRLIPFGAAIAIGIGACQGLHYAHCKSDSHGNPLGIVHRDVSPANLLVTYDGCVKLVDFGVAKLTASNRATRVQAIKGKVAYMSPEQCRGKPLDRRSDIFSLGIVLWEVTVGQRLFQGRTDIEIFQKIVDEDAPCPTKRRANYPRPLARIVRRCLARKADDRYDTVQDVQRDLEAFAREQRLECSSLALADLMVELFPEAATPPPMAPARRLAVGTEAPPARGVTGPQAQGSSSPVARGTSSPVAQSTSSPVAQSTSSPVAQSTSSPVAQGTSSPTPRGTHPPLRPSTPSPERAPTLPAPAPPAPTESQARARSQTKDAAADSDQSDPGQVNDKSNALTHTRSQALGPGVLAAAGAALGVALGVIAFLFW